MKYFDENDPIKRPKYMFRMYQASAIFEPDPGTGEVVQGAVTNTSVVINNADFLLRQVSAAVIGPANIDYGGGTGICSEACWQEPVQGAWGFSVQMRTDSHVYVSEFVDMVAAFGSPNDEIDLPVPVIIRPKGTVSFDVRNDLKREGRVVVQMLLKGIEPAEAYPERL